jgi:hypothetical protein
MRNRWRKAAGWTAAILLVAATGWFARDFVMRVALEGAAFMTGYRLHIGALHATQTRLVLRDIHVRRRGDRVADVAEIDVDYVLRDLLPGGKRRYGLAGLTVVQPHVFIIRRADGTFNVKLPEGKPARPQAPGTPLLMRVRVAGGSLDLIDEQNLDPSAQHQHIANLRVVANIDTGGLTRYRIDGALIDEAHAYPLRAQAAVDMKRGYAMQRISALQLPIRALGNFLINSDVALLQRGELRNLDVRLYALNIRPGIPFAYHLAGGAQLSGIGVKLDVLTQPVEDLNGPIIFDDDAIVSPKITGRIGTTPLALAGGMYNFAQPQFRLAVQTREDLRVLHRDFNFLRTEPLAGPIAANCLLEGAISEPLILADAWASHVSYRTIPIRNFQATIAYHAGVVFAGAVKADVGGVHTRVAARFLVGGKDVDSEAALAADAPPGRMPYLDRITPAAATHITLIGSGTNLLLDTHGVLTAAGGGESVSTTFALNPQGVGELGPFIVRQPGGGIDGAFIMDREHGTSALWANARGLRLYPANPGAAIAGVDLPPFPPIAGRFDGKIIGIDVAERLILLGAGSTTAGNFLGVPIAQARAEFGGPIDHLALAGIDARGEFGHFVGRGALRAPGFAFDGNLDGTFEGMRRWTGDLGAFGKIRGPIAVISDGTRTLVQTPGVNLKDARIHGVPLQHIAGTFAVEPTRIVVYAADADVAGGRAVARGNSIDGIRLATSRIDAARLRGAGAPFQRGEIVGIGALRLSASESQPSFTASIALQDGAIRGQRIDGSANITLDNSGIAVGAAAVNVDRAFGFVDGKVSDLGGTPQYDVRAQIGYAELATFAGALPAHVPYLNGFLGGDVQLHGSGKSPQATALLHIPIGSVNGLNFEDMSAKVGFDRGVINADGNVTVGSTRAKFGIATGDGFRAQIDANAANLADFNDFFPVAGTFAGTGSVHAHFVRKNGNVASDGNVNLVGLRYSRFSFGDTSASWDGAGGTMNAKFHVAGSGGSLDAGGHVVVPRGVSLLKLARAAELDLHGSVRDFDLNTWLPALGYTVPVLGHVNASAAVRGHYPGLDVNFDGEMDDARIGRVDIDRVHLAADAQGGPNVGLHAQISSAEIAIDGVDVKGSGSFGSRPGDPISFNMSAHAAHLNEFIERTTGKNYDVDGVGDVQITVRGKTSQPAAAATFALTPLRLGQLTIPSFTGTATIDRERLALSDATVNLPNGKITLNGGVPLMLGPRGVPPSLPLSFDLALADIGLDQFAVLAPPKTKLAGTVNGSVQVRGTVGEPRLLGGIDLVGGAYSGPVETRPVSDVSASLAFNETSATLSRLDAEIGGGSLTGSGTLELPTASGSPPHYDASFALNGIRLAFPGYGSFRGDGSLTLEGAPPGSPGSLGGELRISEASIPLNDFLKASEAPGAATFNLAPAVKPAVAARSSAMQGLPIPPWLADLGLNLRIAFGNNVRIRSPILDIGGKGAVQIAGKLSDPTLDGEFSATPGGSLFLNRAFKLQEASVRFAPQNGISPVLYARATTQIQQYSGYQPIDVTVTAQGVIPDIKLSYASNPPYDEATIVGLLFNATALGASVGTLNSFAPTNNILLPPNAFEQTPAGTFALSQEASSLINAQFTARLLAPVEQGIGSAFGLSDLAINVAPSGNVGVQARQLLGNNVSALYGTSLQYPYRMTFGLESRPGPETALTFLAFAQQGLYPFGGVKPDSFLSANPLLGSAADVGGTYGFTVNIQRRSQ